jgi:hypothetical protein
VAISANAAVRDDPVPMDDTALSGPGFEVNAHCQGVFHTPHGRRIDHTEEYEEEPLQSSDRHQSDIKTNA